MAAAPLYAGSIKNYVVQIVNGSGTSYVTLYDPPANGGEVLSICVTSDNASAKDVTLAVDVSGTQYPLLTKTIAADAGQIATTPAVDLLNSVEAPWCRLDRNGNRTMLLQDTSVLKVKVLTAATTDPISFFLQAREV